MCPSSSYLPDFELGCAPLWGRDVPPERPRPVLLPLRLLTALPVLVSPPGVGVPIVVNCKAMPPTNRRLDDLQPREGVDGARGALRLGLRRVPERAALVPPPSEEAAVFADGEGVAATGYDGGDGVGTECLHAVCPVLLLVPAHAKLPVLPGTPREDRGGAGRGSHGGGGR